MKKILIMLLMAATMAACSEEQSAIDSLRDIVEDVEQNAGTYSDDDWEDLPYRVEEVNDELRQCKLTAEQKKEVAHLRQRLGTAVGKHTASRLQQGIEEAAETLGGFVDGFTSGMKDATEQSSSEDADTDEEI